jgi:hypothetical protein
MRREEQAGAFCCFIIRVSARHVCLDIFLDTQSFAFELVRRIGT